MNSGFICNLLNRFNVRIPCFNDRLINLFFKNTAGKTKTLQEKSNCNSLGQVFLIKGATRCNFLLSSPVRGI